MIDPTARIDSGARIGANVAVGPYCVIGPDVTIADDCKLTAHVHITGHTTVGARTRIAPFVSIGGPPQSVKYRGGPTRVVIGADCDLRENVTVNLGTEDDRGVTEIGDRCFLMAGSHIAHDCQVGNNVTFANNVLLGGHCHIGDNVVFGGGVAVRQFVRIGEGAMIVGLSGVRADVIPFAMAHGSLADLIGLNVVGLRRRGVSRAQLQTIRQAYLAIFFGEDTFAQRVTRAQEIYAGDPVIGKIFDFIRTAKRPLTMAVHRSAGGEEP